MRKNLRKNKQNHINEHLIYKLSNIHVFRILIMSVEIKETLKNPREVKD